SAVETMKGERDFPRVGRRIIRRYSVLSCVPGQSRAAFAASAMMSNGAFTPGSYCMPDIDIREASLEYHRRSPPGKISLLPTKQLLNQRDLALAYSPGVAAACDE